MAPERPTSVPRVRTRTRAGIDRRIWRLPTTAIFADTDRHRQALRDSPLDLTPRTPKMLGEGIAGGCINRAYLPGKCRQSRRSRPGSPFEPTAAASVLNESDRCVGRAQVGTPTMKPSWLHPPGGHPLSGDFTPLVSVAGVPRNSREKGRRWSRSKTPNRSRSSGSCTPDDPSGIKESVFKHIRKSWLKLARKS